ncbi:hypothetical protein ACLB2K_045394 [Fragaria x ananassa]
MPPSTNLNSGTGQVLFLSLSQSSLYWWVRTTRPELCKSSATVRAATRFSTRSELSLLTTATRLETASFRRASTELEVTPSMKVAPFALIFMLGIVIVLLLQVFMVVRGAHSQPSVVAHGGASNRG